MPFALLRFSGRGAGPLSANVTCDSCPGENSELQGETGTTPLHVADAVLALEPRLDGSS